MGSFSYHVGQRIKKYRKSRGYTIEQFSAMINKSKATLSKYENGTITIDIETLYDIAQALNIDLKCFIDYQPPVFHQEQHFWQQSSLQNARKIKEKRSWHCFRTAETVTIPRRCSRANKNKK